jgi:hypothetical protein
MSPVAIGIMVVAGIGMLIGLSKQKAGAAWGKPLAMVCIVVALATAVMNIVKTSGGGNTAGIVEREMQYQKVGAQKLGSHLAEKYSGSKALIIVEPKLGAAADKPNVLVEGLKEGFGSAITVVAEESPEIPENAAKAFAAEMPPMEGGEGGMEGEMLPPLEYWYTASLVNKLLDKYDGKYDMIVTTIGLPQDAKRLDIWKGDKKPKVALASGSVYELRGAIKSGAIVAAVTYNPQAEYDDKPVPKDLDEAFNKRFLLLTPENIDQIASKHPDIFAK